jgi:hypothetical protein
VTCNRNDLRLGTAFEREPCYCRSAEIIERDAYDASLVARLDETGAEAIGGPRLIIGVE